MPIDILAPLRRLATWWNRGEPHDKQMRLAVIGLLIAAIALWPVIHSAFLASPEENLAKLGYQKTYQDFWRAVVNKHTQAVELFAKAHVRLEPRDFRRVFDDRVFNADVFAALRHGGSIDAAHCPSEIQGLDLYASVTSHPDKARAIRRVCALPTVVAAIEAAKAAEQARIAQVLARNQLRPARVKDCVARYRAQGDQRLIAEASRFDLLRPTTYTERECVLARLNQELLLGGRTLMNPNGAFRTIVRTCCEQYDPPQPSSDAGIRAADAALALLGRGASA